MSLKTAKAEVALAKKLQTLLATPGVSFFFEPRPERDWDEFQAEAAWNAWLPGQLSDAENKLYQEHFANECLDMSEIVSMINIESNRVPSGWNDDGY